MDTVITCADKPSDTTPARVNVAAAFLLRYEKGLTYQQIADLQGVKKQSVHRALQRFEDLMPDPDELRAYRDNKSSVLEGIEFGLINDLADPDRRKSASLNNTAYAFNQVSNALRLERGQSTANVDVQGISAGINARAEQVKVLDKELADLLDDPDEPIDITPDTTSE